MTIGADEKLLVDASVAVKWVIAEPDSEIAAALLDHHLAAPDLLFAECAHILWKKVRRGELNSEQAEVAAQTLEQADLHVVSARAYLAAAVAIAVELDHPACDGLYLAIADALGLRLVTADTRLVRRLNRAPGRLRRLAVALSDAS